MKKKYISFLFFIFSIQGLISQSLQLSVYSEVSIITVGPGNALFEAFGHSAIRIKDPLLKIDVIYNYGVFDFTPGFYINFAKGRLLYKLQRQPFDYFLQSNKVDKRWMKSQILDLTQQERHAFFQYLENNALPKNASYNYDPYFDNCATKLRDITHEILKDKVQFSNEYVTREQSLRQLMNEELSWNTWGSFGINLALGTKLDKVASASEYMYLPDYIYSAFKSAKKLDNGSYKPLIIKEEILLSFNEKKQKISWYNPFFIFSLLFLIVVYVTYKDYINNKRSKWLDFTIFFITGISGILIVFLWFFTDHTTTPNNFNILWAFPLNFFMAFLLLKKHQSKWIRFYLKFGIALLLITLLVWIIKVQLFSLAILPLLAMLIIRYYYVNTLLSFKK